jgi:hypothetical protein
METKEILPSPECCPQFFNLRLLLIEFFLMALSVIFQLGDVFFAHALDHGMSKEKYTRRFSARKEKGCESIPIVFGFLGRSHSF